MILRDVENVLVLGGGITGQLAQHVIPYARVAEGGPANKSLTRVWGTNYLWEPVDGVPCHSFQVITHIDGDPASVTSMLAYKTKVGKENEPSLGWEKQFKTMMTGWNFSEPIQALITYDKTAKLVDPTLRRVYWNDGTYTRYEWLINTIPLPALVVLLGESSLGQHLADLTVGRFIQSPIYIRIQPRPLDARFPRDVLYVNYLSDQMQPAYRYCDRGEERHYEGLTNMGVIPSKKIIPGKIHDIDPRVLRDVHDELEAVGIYCFGRFAKWQSDELVHETYRDLKLFAQEHSL